MFLLLAGLMILSLIALVQSGSANTIIVDDEDGDYLNAVELTEKGKWIDKKGWDKLEVRKR